jgi:hypothetical protein
MTSKRIAGTSLILTALAVAPLSAQTLKPGLWEVKVAGNGAAGSGKAMSEQMARMKQQMAAMPAEQRKQFEAAMQASDASEVQFTDDGMSMKHCISKEEGVDFHTLLAKDGNCTSQRSPMSAGVIKLNVSCTTPPTVGTGTITFQGDTGYALDMTMRSKSGDASHTRKIGSTGKWLSADCGKLKSAIPR